MSALPMDLSRMQPLPASAVRYLFVHTTGTPDGSDTSAEAVNRYHRKPEKDGGPPGGPWAGIGYHFLIRKNGDVEAGRPLDRQGSHVRGVNHCSIGVALSGNGDLHPATSAQLAALVLLLCTLSRSYRVPVERILGHREVRLLIADGLLAKEFHTDKSCPGRRVSMEKVRHLVRLALEPPAADPVDPGTPALDRVA